jgi:hypothetical protein
MRLFKAKGSVLRFYCGDFYSIYIVRLANLTAVETGKMRKIIAFCFNKAVTVSMSTAMRRLVGSRANAD